MRTLAQIAAFAPRVALIPRKTANAIHDAACEIGAHSPNNLSHSPSFAAISSSEKAKNNFDNAYYRMQASLLFRRGAGSMPKWHAGSLIGRFS